MDFIASYVQACNWICIGDAMSEKLLPIVAGCRALIIYPGGPICKTYLDRYGREVTVIKKDSMQSGRWIVSGNGLDIIVKTFRIPNKDIVIPESYLMRIDGFNFKHERDSYELPIANEY